MFFLILCIYAIRKKFRTKKKIPFSDLIFFTYRGGKRRRGGREIKKGKTEKEQYTHRINSNSPGESIARERERVLFL
jgi:hypothetical protein